MTDPLTPDAITALIAALRVLAVDISQSTYYAYQPKQVAVAMCQSADALAALSAQVERLQVLNDQVAAMGVTDCERADAAEARLEGTQGQRNTLYAALETLLAEPYDCSLCDSGTPRNPAKGHQLDCPYDMARTALRHCSPPGTPHTQPYPVLPQGDGDSG